MTVATATRDSRAIERDVAEYLATGHADANGWTLYPGNTIVEAMAARHRTLRDALVARVVQLGAGRAIPPAPAHMADFAFPFRKLEPMVRGLSRERSGASCSTS